MCIYCGTKRYRSIYKQHFGAIPKDETGRSYEIHHIDGDHANNNPENLKCVSIQEHYDIHLSQGDYGAAYAIAVRMKKTHEELSELSRINASKSFANGTNPFLNPEVQKKGVAAAKIVNAKRLADGTHNFLGGRIQRESNRKRLADGTHNILTLSRKMVEDGTHNWLGGNAVRQQLETNTHTSKIKISCIFCKATVDKGNFSKWHGDNCIKNGAVRRTCFSTDNHSKILIHCPHCQRDIQGKGNFSRWHGDNCRLKSD